MEMAETFSMKACVPGLRPESLAAAYYGNRTLAIFIRGDNGLLPGGKLKVGQRVRIPTAFQYQVRRGDSLEAIARKFLDDPRRASPLAAFNGIKLGDKLKDGQELVIPFEQ